MKSSGRCSRFLWQFPSIYRVRIPGGATAFGHGWGAARGCCNHLEHPSVVDRFYLFPIEYQYFSYTYIYCILYTYIYIYETQLETHRCSWIFQIYRSSFSHPGLLVTMHDNKYTSCYGVKRERIPSGMSKIWRSRDIQRRLGVWC